MLGAAVADGDDVGGRVPAAHEWALVAALGWGGVGVGVLRVAAGGGLAVSCHVEGGEVAVGFVDGVEES